MPLVERWTSAKSAKREYFSAEGDGSKFLEKVDMRHERGMKWKTLFILKANNRRNVFEYVAQLRFFSALLKFFLLHRGWKSCLVWWVTWVRLSLDIQQNEDDYSTHKADSCEVSDAYACSSPKRNIRGTFLLECDSAAHSLILNIQQLGSRADVSSHWTNIIVFSKPTWHSVSFVPLLHFTITFPPPAV